MSASVLLVGEDPPLAQAIADAGHTVLTAPADAAPDAAATRDVECVVAPDDSGEGDGFAVATAVRDRNPAVPVAVVGEAPLSAVAEAATGPDVAAYVHRDGEAAPSGLVGAIEGAVATYRRRRDRGRLPDGPDPGCVVRDGTVSAASPECSDLLGGTVAGRPLSALAEEEDRAAVASAVGDGGDAVRSVRFTPANVPNRTVEARLRGTPDGAVVASLLDVTERANRVAELEREAERLEEFAEVLTHDVRNPLNVAQGYLDLLRVDPDEESVESCADALDRIESIVEEVRASVLRDRGEPDPAPVDLETLAREAWATADTGAATLVVEGSMRIRTDPAQFRRLLENLFRNAVEHGSTSSRPEADDAVEHGSTSPRSNAREDATEHGSAAERRGADLTVRVRVDDDGFAVTDDGVGLPESVAGDVFDRGVSTTASGSGFGLAIVRNVARRHGWEVSAGASEEGGARFAFSNVLGPDEAVVEMEAGGADIWDAADEGTFYCATREGDFDVRVEVLSVESTHAWAKGGLMVRSSTAPDAAHVMVRRRPDGHATVQWRPTDGDDTRSLTSQSGRSHRESDVAEPAHDWLRLVREGESLRAYTSETGEDGDWMLLADLDGVAALPPAALVGVAGTSHNRAASASIRFANLSGVEPDTATDLGDPIRPGEVRVIQPVLLATREATAVTATTATLGGSVESMQAREELAVHFEYREVTAEEWTATEPRTVSETGGVEAAVTGLAPRRYYEYRVVGDYGDGQVESSTTTLVGTPGESPGADRRGPRSGSHVDPGDGFGDVAPWLDDDTPVVRITEPDREQLQAALSVDGPRVVAFETSGTIDLEGRDLTVTGSECWLAGQTAPSPGVTLTRGRLVVSADDCVVQHVRVRPGDGGPDADCRAEALLVDEGTTGTVVDHCTLTWSASNNLNVKYRTRETTVTNCLVAEGLYDAAGASDTQGYCTLVGDGSRDVALLGNLWAHHKGRHPRLRGGTTAAVVNNVAHNFGYAAYLGGEADGDTLASVVGNHYRSGEFSHPPPEDEALVTAQSGESEPVVHLADNHTEPAALPQVGAGVRTAAEPPVWPAGLEAMPAADVLAHTLDHAGARPADRTHHDERVVESVREADGRVVDSQADVGGYPSLPENTAELAVPERNLRAWLREEARAVEP